MARLKLSRADLRVGVSLPFSVYSASGDLLLGRGNVIKAQTQIERLLEMGALRDEAFAERRASNTGKVFGILNSHAQVRSTDRPAQGPVMVPFPTFLREPDFFLVSARQPEEVTFSANYVGMIKGKGLLLTVPASAEFLQSGVDVQGKIVLGRYIYIFSSCILSRVSEPFDIVHIGFPTEATRQIFRRHLRVDVRLNALVIRNDTMTTGFDATVVNISLGGMAISVPEGSLRMGEHFRVSLKLPSGDRLGPSLTLTGIVRNVSNPASAHNIVGIELGGLSDPVRASLQNYIFDVATSPGQA